MMESDELLDFAERILDHDIGVRLRDEHDQAVDGAAALALGSLMSMTEIREARAEIERHSNRLDAWTLVEDQAALLRDAVQAGDEEAAELRARALRVRCDEFKADVEREVVRGG